MKNKKPYRSDAFISYSSSDVSWVKEVLVKKLEGMNLIVSIDYLFEAGLPIIDNISKAIIRSEKTLLVITRRYLDSDWTKLERNIAQSTDPASHQKKLIPLLKEDVLIPFELRHLTHIDFASPKNQDDAWKKLAACFRKECVEDNLGTVNDRISPQVKALDKDRLIKSNVSQACDIQRKLQLNNARFIRKINEKMKKWKFSVEIKIETWGRWNQGIYRVLPSLQLSAVILECAISLVNEKEGYNNAN